MKAKLVVHYGEIGTKGNNRDVFERCLARNVASMLHPIPLLGIRKVNQRFLLEVDYEGKDAAIRRLAETFGVSWCAVVDSVELSYDRIMEKVLALVRNEGIEGSTFRITARRPSKAFEITSSELARRLGAAVVERLGARVDLTSPAINISVDVLSDQVLVYSRKIKGPGGLPVGVSGKAIHLLSGGIDSPVAAWYMMKRGCRMIYLHFYMGRDTSEVLDSKILRIVKRLSRYGGRSMIVLLPFSVYQVATASFPQKYEPLVFRAFMRRIAEVMAQRLDAQAISTGDNLGQVASQTLHNLGSMDRGASLPILRPLLTFNKTEIIEVARSIGTYDLSIEVYKDCCALLSRHPKTRANPELVDLLVKRLSFDEMLERLIEDGVVAVYEPANDSVVTRPLARYFRPMIVNAPEQA